eukprot:jgi/Psemu1/288028/fgenesh1_pg.230_\
MTQSETGSDASSSSNRRHRFDRIAEELRFLSDLHRMTERGGHEISSNIDSRSTGTGRTRSLKPHDRADFVDEDFFRAPNNNDTSSSSSSSSTRNDDDDGNADRYRRFRLFNRFARSVCKIKAIARKEVFEAWAMALYVHECFLSSSSLAQSNKDGKVTVRRFADLACSHGLLSWALLLLSSAETETETIDDGGIEMNEREHEREHEREREREHDDYQEQDQVHRPLTAVCIDIDMPKSSETAAKIFFDDYPQFRDDGSSCSSLLSSSSPHARWDYVEGPVEFIVPDPSTLLVGIHACGKLSDAIIDQAIRSNSQMALVPCCHSKKILTPSQKTDYAALVSNNHTGVGARIPSYTLADFMDAYRTQRLIDAGYRVDEVMIPEEFTPKNRILLATPPHRKMEGRPEPPPARARRSRVLRFDIPIADTPSARATIRSIAGKEAGNRRLIEAHPPPTIGLSVWLPSDGDGDGDSDQSNSDGDEEAFTVEALQRAIDGEFGEGGTTTNGGGGGRFVTVESVQDQPHVSPNDGRRSHTFRVHYLHCRNDKSRARALHKILRDVTIPRCFPSVTVRGV